MERLTKHDLSGNKAYYKEHDYSVSSDCETKNIILRLCEYEDIGLTPREIKEIIEKAKMYDGLCR